MTVCGVCEIGILSDSIYNFLWVSFSITQFDTYIAYITIIDFSDDVVVSLFISSVNAPHVMIVL